MSSLNTYSNISSFVNTIYEGALLVARDNNVMAALVTPFGDRTGLAVRSNQQYGGATINTIGETDDLTSQAFTPAAIATLTPVEKGGQYFLTDSRVESDPFNVQREAALDLGMAMATEMEGDLLTTFSSMTGGTVGAAGTVIAWGHFFAMLTRLKVQKAPMPYYFVCHPYQWHQLGKAASVAGTSVLNAPQFQDEVTRNFYVGTVGGVEIYTSSNITIDASDDAYCGMFSRQALALDIRRAPRMESERDASRRGIELNFTAVYAAGVWRPAFGIQGLFDATVPTS